jgi:hypothetical protein
MSAPVTNQSYIQQNNQLFDWAKTATPQQIEAAKQGLPKDSPLLLAIGMGVQYQQQARAPHPQAPQKTVMEQKLGEFAQTSAQGLPSVGGNQMAMQQVDPMRGAGIGVAPENTPAPQPQAPQPQAPQPQAPQQAATGGLVALARGGEVRHFANGGLGDLTKYLSQGEADPNAYGADSAIASMLNENTTPMLNVDDEPTQKTKLAPIGIDDIVSMANPTSSAARNEAAPTHRERKDAIKELLGAPEDYSEEIATAKEDVRSANKDKWGGALAQGIGAYLSAPTQYQSRALGAGLLAGASGYAQGAKDEQSANKDLMALQMAHKKALVSGDKEAATILLNNMAEQEKAIALAKSKKADLKDKFGYDVLLKEMEGKQGLVKQEAAANQAISLEEFRANNDQLLEKVKADIDTSGGLKPQHRSAIYNALVGDVGADRAEELFPMALELVMSGATTKPLGGLGNTKPLGNNSGFSMTLPSAQ